jgi:hypothetical protein
MSSPSISSSAPCNGRASGFPQSAVDYRVADLFDAPSEWRGAFDLVHELYTLQALPGNASA